MKVRLAQHILCGVPVCLMLLFSITVQAAFITDKIVVEVFAQRFSQGAVLKKLSSGSSVEVLTNDGEYSRIRTNDNITGWVESKLLTNEKPTQLEYLELLGKSKALEAKLKIAEENLANPAQGGGDGIDIAEIEELRKRASDSGWMRVELKKTRDRLREVETKLKSTGQEASSSQGELITLREQNKALQERLAASVLVSEQKIDVAPQQANTTPTTSDDENSWTIDLKWFFGSLVAALIVGLITGISWLDKRIRKRHGGFRIY